jgi:GDP-4-dehydro-6-deoxy-D-mannose reductase
MKVLLTGDSGFVGQNLRAMHAERGLGDRDFIRLPAEFDLRSADSVAALLPASGFDAVIHLAAQSNVPASWADPLGTYDVNLLGTVRLLEQLQKNGFGGRFLYVSSGDVYGPVAEHELPVSETTPARPANPYAASKVAAEVAALSWGRRGAFDVIVARPFNHLGPGQATTFSVPRFADALARMQLGLLPPQLATGRLDVSRDFLDVRDVVEAYVALLDHGRAGEIYNVASGVEQRLDGVLQQLIELSQVQVELSLDPGMTRPVDQPRMVGDAAKLRADTGWSPTIPLSDTLRSVLSYFIKLHTP